MQTDCIFEPRSEDGQLVMGNKTTRAWCQTHGFDCPTLKREGAMHDQSGTHPSFDQMHDAKATGK